jgi:hypothetical protein
MKDARPCASLSAHAQSEVSKTKGARFPGKYPCAVEILDFGLFFDLPIFQCPGVVSKVYMYSIR